MKRQHPERARQLQDGLDEDTGMLADGVYVTKAVAADDTHSGDIAAPSAFTTQEGVSAVFGRAGALKPPFDPARLVWIWENSGALNPNVDSYVTNIDGTGHTLELSLDLEGNEGKERVREAMWLEQRANDAGSDVVEDEAVDARVSALKREAREEAMIATQFFTNANSDGSFVSLRRITRQDLEVTGNAYWECLRNKEGNPARFRHVPSVSMRLSSVDPAPYPVTDRAPGLLAWDEVVHHRYFRRYVQAVTGRAVFFKEFGDPRFVSRLTGKAYATVEEFNAKKTKGDLLANEMIHFKINKSGEAYGVPRWIGNLLAVLGSRAADEVNYDYFDSKAVPPMVLMVQGARMNADDVSRIQSYFTDMVKGRKNFHRVLVVQANISKDDALSGVTTAPKLEFKDLGASQSHDGQFKEYDERNIDKIGSSFRLPRLMRGDVRDFNRATAEASRQFAEEQVFDPERTDFDSIINRRIMPELGVRLLKFRSLGLKRRDPEVIVGALDKLMARGVIVPNEARRIASDALGVELPPIDADWARQPMPLTLAGFDVTGLGETDDGEGDEGAKLPGHDFSADVAEALDEKEKERLAELANEARRIADAGDAAQNASRAESASAIADDIEQAAE
jgi:PBSX family phage portal protein